MDGITVRRLKRTDMRAGFLESLDSLRNASGIEPARAASVFDSIESNPNHLVFVAECGGRIVGTATLLVEHKFIHNGGIAGHIEDVAVHSGKQRAGVGRRLVERLIKEAERAGCYKVTLECADDLVAYYEGLGFSRHSVTMRRNLG